MSNRNTRCQRIYGALTLRDKHEQMDGIALAMEQRIVRNAPHDAALCVSEVNDRLVHAGRTP